MRRILLILAILAVPVSAFAQTPVTPVVDWNEVIALAVNTVLVFVGVQLVKGYGPNLSTAVKQVLALAGGPLLMMFAQPYLSEALGYPVDFGPLAAALSGLVSGVAAMGAFDFAKISGGAK